MGLEQWGRRAFTGSTLVNVLGGIAAVCVFAVIVMAINQARKNYESRGDEGESEL